MRKIFIISSIGVLMLLSCIKDLGSYKYEDINEVTISGIEKTYNVNMGVEALNITPEISMTKSNDNLDGERFEYRWILYTDVYTKDTIAKTRVLNQILNYPPATYTVYFKMVDKTTGIIWKQKTEVTVGTPYTKGFMVLGENATTGIVELQTISMSGADTVVYGDALKNSGLPDLSDPIKVLHTGKSTVNPKLWVMTGSGSYYLDVLTMKSDITMCFDKILLIPSISGEEHVVEQFPHICAYDGKTAYDYYRGYITDKGNLYYTMSLAMGDFYDYPHNCTIKYTDPAVVFYKAAPYAMHYIKSSMSGLIWYDTDNDRFLSDTSPIGDKSTALTDKPTDPFPWNNQSYNRKFVYGENTFNTDGGSTNGNSFAVMKSTIDDNGYIYKFYAKTTPEKRSGYTVRNSAAPDFAKASQYAFSSLRTVVFYTFNGKLFAYNYNPGHEQCFDMTSYIGGDPVTMVMFDTQSQPTKDYLYVATFNNTTGGRIRKFAIGANLDAVELVAHPYFDYSGFCKVKHMSWRGSK